MGSTQPYRGIIGGTTIAGGTLDQTTGRRVEVVWPPDAPFVDLGCHTATLVASHLFDSVPECPSCEDDFSMITWPVLRCDSSMGTCDSLPLSGSMACPVQPNPIKATTCESLPTHGAHCPDTTDGGAP